MFVCVCVCVCVRVRVRACVCVRARFSYLHLCVYGRINSVKSQLTGKGNVSEPRFMSQVVRVHIDQLAFTNGAVEVPVFACLCSCCYHVTEGVGRKVCDTHAEGCHAI
jgi:hypothetical protein